VRVDATIVNYGRCDKNVEEVEALYGPVLGHFAQQDEWINQEMVDNFEYALLKAGKEYAIYWYDAKHAFANPTQAPRYDAGSATLAWERSLAFLKKNLG
jgi:carboxymethylenebutenolidase